MLFPIVTHVQEVPTVNAFLGRNALGILSARVEVRIVAVAFVHIVLHIEVAVGGRSLGAALACRSVGVPLMLAGAGCHIHADFLFFCCKEVAPFQQTLIEWDA